MPPDITPPAAVTGITAFNITTTGADLSWSASTDSNGVTAYRLKTRRSGGTRWHRTTTYPTFATTTGLTWHVTGTPAIVSEPWIGNVFTAVGNLLPALAPAAFPAGAVWHSVSTSSGYFTWTPAAGQEGVQTFTVTATSATGSASLSRTVTTYPAGTDLIPPSAVGSLVVDQVSFDACRATWIAATDNYGVVNYRVSAVHREPRRRFHRGTYHDHVVAFDVLASAVQATIPGLRASTSYVVSVTARDAAGLAGYALTREIRTLLQPFVIEAAQVTTLANGDGSTSMTWPGYGFYWKFTVECSPDLLAWSPIEPASQWPGYVTTFTFTPELGVPSRFYRVKATPAVAP